MSVIWFLASYILGLIKSEDKKSQGENVSDFCINLKNQSDAGISASQLKLILVELYELSQIISVILFLAFYILGLITSECKKCQSENESSF